MRKQLPPATLDIGPTYVFPGPRAIRFLTLWALLCLAGLSIADNKGKPGDDEDTLRFRSPFPLGAESFSVVRPWKGTLTLMASVENPQLEGWTRLRQGRHYVVRAADGEAVRFYPENLEFRITASLRTRLFDPSPFPLTTNSASNDYLLGLRFRVVVFRGLHKTVLQPEAVEMIGVPADLTYDERIFRVSVKLPHIPMEDRLVLEVLSPQGERITKFHVDLI
jgi:hypothetical protein